MARKGNIQKFQQTHILENGGLLKFVCAKESASPKWVGKVVYPSFLYGLMQKRFGNEVKQRQKQPESIVTLPASSNPAYRYHTFPLPMYAFFNFQLFTVSRTTVFFFATYLLFMCLFLLNCEYGNSSTFLRPLMDAETWFSCKFSTGDTLMDLMCLQITPLIYFRS